jgi:F-type H+-transporting ATPase subunit delta
MSAHRYAKALFDIALEKGSVGRVSEDIDRFFHLAGKSSDWMTMMDAPLLTDGQKFQAIDDLGIDPSFSALLKTLIRSRNIMLFGEIREAWVEMARSYQKIAHIDLHSATPLSDRQTEAIRRVLAPRFEGRTITFSVTVDENLIGGLKIIHNGQSIDRTIARELSELELSI